MSAGVPADLASVFGLFGRELHRAGIPVSPSESAQLARVVQVCDPLTVDQLYWCARVSLLRSPDQVPEFNAVFALVFRGLADVAEHRGQEPSALRSESRPPRQAAGEQGSERPPAGPAGTRAGPAGEQEGDAEPHVLRALASSEERLRHADFGALSDAELAEVAPLLHQLLTTLPTRRSRRRHRHPRGDRLDVRATIRRSIRSGGDPVLAVRRSRRRRPRRLVALLDISGSMEPYARAWLHLLWGAATVARAEVFVFGTRLTRLTPVLRTRSPQQALARAGRAMPDWSGGTRIGHNLKAFMHRYGRSGMAHGAVVLVVSDGWERDDPAVLGAQMEAIARRAHRVVWVNPRAVAPGFAPDTGGMRAALPFCDDLLSGHSVEALAEVVAALGGDRQVTGRHTGR
ncbi:vWA domain-containing protein [Oryzihumus sp.]